MTVAILVHLLVDPDREVQFPALKAVANMLTTETTEIVDKALDQHLLDNLLQMALQEPWCKLSQSLQEICFCFNNVACGTELQIQSLLSHPNLWEHVLTHLIPKSVDLRQKKEAFLIVSNAVLTCTDDQLLALVLCNSKDRLVSFFEAIVHVLTTMTADCEAINSSFNVLTRCFELHPD